MNLFKMKLYKVTVFFTEDGEEKNIQRIIEARSKREAIYELASLIIFNSYFRCKGGGLGGRPIESIVAKRVRNGVK